MTTEKDNETAIQLIASIYKSTVDKVTDYLLNGALLAEIESILSADDLSNLPRDTLETMLSHFRKKVNIQLQSEMHNHAEK